jgi:osmotically-inducible protein OsmY
MNAWKERRSRRRACLIGAAAWLGTCGTVLADSRPLDTIVVSARRLADEQIRIQVETALRNDPTLMSNHLDVSIKDGVVTLSGLVFDDWDLRLARRAAKRVPGVKRVVNDLEIKLGGE